MNDLLKQAIDHREHPQISLVTDWGLDSHLRSRGLNFGLVGVRRSAEAGLFLPLGHDEQLFHPFQVWRLVQLTRHLNLDLAPAAGYFGFDFEKWQSYVDKNLDQKVNALQGFLKESSLADFHQRLLPFLLWLESYFLPVIRGPKPGVVEYSGMDCDGWVQWRGSFELKALLISHTLTVDDIAQWRNKVLSEAVEIDPVPDYYLLFRSMPFNQRRRFGGRLALAFDLYEIAELLRMFLEEVGADPVTKEWDPRGHPTTPWVENNYGMQPSFGDPRFLRPLIRHFGLDPAYRVEWLVEGPTEEGFIDEFAACLGATLRDFTTIRNYAGDGGFGAKSSAMDADLGAANEQQCFVTITFDETPKSRERFEELKVAQLVNLACVLNEPDFELQNFTVRQLCQVAAAQAEENGESLELDLEMLIGRVQERLDKGPANFKKAIDDVAHFNGSTFRLAKGYRWGQNLAKCLFNESNSDKVAGQVSLENQPKIVRQVIAVLRASQPHIDFPLSMAHLETTSLELK